MFQITTDALIPLNHKRRLRVFYTIRLNKHMHFIIL